MGRFSKTQEPPKTRRARKANAAGGLGFEVDPRVELYRVAASSFLSGTYYTKQEKQLKRVQQLVGECDIDFVLKLAKYVRNEMHIRTLPVVLLAEAAGKAPGQPKPEVIRYAPQILKRADELAEVIAYWINVKGDGRKKGMPNALKKGVAASFDNFDEYQFGKYQGKKNDVTLSDVVKLTHPKPETKDRAKLYKSIMDGTIKVPVTRETVLSREGQSRGTWNKLAPNMGLLALIRNLKNFETHGAEEAIAHAIKRLKDPKSVRNSRILPFRFFIASTMVTRTDLKRALEAALNLSVGNAPELGGVTVFLVDRSGSMDSRLSAHSTVSIKDIGAVMAGLGMKRTTGESKVIAYGDHAVYVDVFPDDSILTMAKQVNRVNSGGGWGRSYSDTYVGHGTNAASGIELLTRDKFKADRIVLLSDMNNWHGDLNGAVRKYRKTVNRDVVLYSINLAGSLTSDLPDDVPNTVLLGGFSEKVFDFMNAYEDTDAVIKLIEGM